MHFLDSRGHGQSGGNANDFGWYGNQDIEGVVAWQDRRPDVTSNRIAVVGESMGGEEAIGAIGADPGIRAVVAEGATGRVVADRAWLPHDVTGDPMRGGGMGDLHDGCPALWRWRAGQPGHVNTGGSAASGAAHRREGRAVCRPLSLARVVGQRPACRAS